LEAHAQAAETLGRTPSDVLDALKNSGLFKILRPRRYGGYGLAPSAMFEVGATLARGCMSTAWVYVNLAIHEIYVAAWPAAIQREVWSDTETLVGSTFVFPAGRAKRVEGGYLLNGRWPFSSGIYPCSWTINGGIVEGEDDRPPETRYFLLREGEYEILDTWRVAALKGTGSADTQVRDLFVPEERTLGYRELLRCEAPGLALNDEWTMRVPLASVGGFVLMAPIYGALRGAFDQFVEAARTRTARSSGKGLASEPTFQSRVSEAAVIIDTLETIINRTYQDMEAAMVAGEIYTGQNALRMRRDGAYCARLAKQAADILFALGGGSALYESSPLQRMWRDVHGGTAHIVYQWDVQGVVSGKVELGLPSGLPGLDV
jgi:3-hydroxy-9,10-secoandrosta-1,3,5(10)-triene-9,17-dione monooxygenase